MYDRKANQLRRLFDAMPRVDDNLLLPMQPIEVLARDGLVRLVTPRQSGDAALLIRETLIPDSQNVPFDILSHLTVRFVQNHGVVVVKPRPLGQTGAVWIATACEVRPILRDLLGKCVVLLLPVHPN